MVQMDPNIKSKLKELFQVLAINGQLSGIRQFQTNSYYKITFSHIF